MPISLHQDHAQSADAIYRAAETAKFDSIMVDMSHSEMAENLSRTAELVRFCQERRSRTEAEPGSINGSKAGIQATGHLKGILTAAEVALQFIATGIDFLAPAMVIFMDHTMVLRTSS